MSLHGWKSKEFCLKAEFLSCFVNIKWGLEDANDVRQKGNRNKNWMLIIDMYVLFTHTLLSHWKGKSIYELLACNVGEEVLILPLWG
jgi:hypothetical protein